MVEIEGGKSPIRGRGSPMGVSNSDNFRVVGTAIAGSWSGCNEEAWPAWLGKGYASAGFHTVSPLVESLRKQESTTRKGGW